MSVGGPLSGSDDVRWRRARRAAAWRYHPDRGGTAAEFIAALAEVDSLAAADNPSVLLTIRRSRRARFARRLHRWRRHRMTRRYVTL